MRVEDGQRHFLRKCNSKNFGLNLVNFSRGFLWVQYFFLWVFRGSNFFSCEYFVGPKFFLVGISRVRNIFL